MYPYMNYSGGFRRRVFQYVTEVFVECDNCPIIFFCHEDYFIINAFNNAFFLKRFYIMSLMTEIGSYFGENIFIYNESQRTVSSNGTYSCSLIRVAA